MDKYCGKNPELQKKSQLEDEIISLIRDMVREKLNEHLDSIDSYSLESLIKGDING